MICQTRPTPSDPVRPRPTPSDPARPRPTPPDPARPRQTPPDPARPRQTPPDPARPRQTPSDLSDLSDPVRPRPTLSDPVRPRPAPSAPVRPTCSATTLNFFHFLARTTLRGGGPLTVGWAKALFAPLKNRGFLENFKQESCTIIDKHRQSSRIATH
jgi:hypothetical protein